MLIDHDFHVHTTLSSCCNDPKSTPENILEAAARAGLKSLAFTDHMWDSSVPGASKWYAPQDYEHIMQIRERLPEDHRGIRVLIGCETEYCGNGKVGISRATAEKLDFVLIPMSHLHMKGFTIAETITAPEDVAALMVQRFHEVLDLGLADAIAHPFLPLGFKEQVDEIVGLISDQQFLDCFGRAAELGVGIEVTTGFFPGLSSGEREGWHDSTFLRVLSLAKQAGCRFHFASDAHTLAGIGNVQNLAPYVAEIGLTREDLSPVARGE